jgi:RNA polymerase sigma-70 factor (ECF subfamily)
MRAVILEQQLVLLAREGDHHAFSQLCALKIGTLTALARLILRDEHLAREAVQDALIDAWRGIRGVRDPEKFDAWLRKILIRACYGRANESARRARLEIELGTADQPLTNQIPLDVERRDHIERALRRLQPEQRAVLVLTYYLDLPLAESAAALSIPLGTMKSRLNRATQALRAALEADDRAPVAAERMPA